MILLPPRSTLFPYTTLFRSKSNSTSAANVTFSATGLGFSGAGFGASAGFGAGGGGGFGAGGGAGFGSGCAGSVAQPATKANMNAARSSETFLIIFPPGKRNLFAYQESA